jgi:hypothetical protein
MAIGTSSVTDQSSMVISSGTANANDNPSSPTGYLNAPTPVPSPELGETERIPTIGTAKAFSAPVVSSVLK